VSRCTRTATPSFGDPAGYGDAVIWRKIAALTALWCALIVIPAVAAGVLLHRGPGNQHMGWVAGIWIVGYLAQFLLFIKIGRKSPCGTGPGKIIAALVPWLADWTTPVTLWSVLPAAIIVIGYSAYLTRSVYRLDVLRRDGVEARGRVVEVIRPALNSVVDRDHARRTMRIEVIHPDGAPAYEATVTATFTLGEIPEQGDSVAIRVDPNHPQRLELIENEPVVRATADPEVDPRTSDQLRLLRTMRDRGDITEAEYTAAKNKLVN